METFKYDLESKALLQADLTKKRGVILVPLVACMFGDFIRNKVRTILICDCIPFITGKLIRFCRIVDLKGLSMSHLNPTGCAVMLDFVSKLEAVFTVLDAQHGLHIQGLKYLTAVLRMGTANYPESLGSMYIVNAPWIFDAAWKTIKPFLKESTQVKIQILGNFCPSV